MLKIGQTAAIVAASNKNALGTSATIVAGNVINKQVVNLITPRLPIMVRGYASTELGEAVIANLVAGVIIHTLPHNEKAVKAAECMIQAASVSFLSSFNIEGMVEDLLKDFQLPADVIEVK